MLRIDDRRVASAIAHLRNPEIAPFVEYLKAQRLEELEGLSQVVAQEQVYRLQGRAEIIKEILLLVEGAEKLVARLK